MLLEFRQDGPFRTHDRCTGWLRADKAVSNAPGRRTRAANGARKDIPRIRFRSQSAPGTGSMTLETSPRTQTSPPPVDHSRKDLTSAFLFCTQHLDAPDPRT